ncbi:hypothetical protein FA13DRAFT_1878351 [Coprinellus micaceus]|uniref:Hexosyltransferase n=1 Tax=Coprinellus micaceus TaxID=71717 RepID=A0A4Y7S0Q8_COPMI|nr:hypothetical protein FA13DRAFT_1878351 [Coprinellus micaceus]
MYPPAVHYDRLSNDPESDHNDDSFTLKISEHRSRLRHYLRPNPLVRVLCILVLALLTWRIISNLTRRPPLKVFALDEEPRPSWLDDKTPDAPMRLRVAVISRAKSQCSKEFVSPRWSWTFDSSLGRQRGLFSWWTISHLESEIEEHGDIEYLRDIDDVKERLSEKRFAALGWGGSVRRTDYDWFMTMDSDTFVRFGALSRRLGLLLKERDVNPQTQSVLVGRMAAHRLFWENRIPDGSTDDPWEEDLFLKGPWYDYPIGIGYMMSPFLVETLLSLDPPPPHHIHYPNDDVMIGGWIAALKHFPDTSIDFQTTPEHSPEPVHKVVPRPYLPHPIDTVVIDDKEGWHDYAGRKVGYDAPFSWSSVCLHHLHPKEMRMLRAMDAIKGEWAPGRNHD